MTGYIYSICADLGLERQNVTDIITTCLLRKPHEVSRRDRQTPLGQSCLFSSVTADLFHDKHTTAVSNTQVPKERYVTVLN
jgi:hypothetical protein